MIPHFAVIANVVQMAHWTKAKDESRPLEMQRYKPGSRGLAGMLALSADLRRCLTRHVDIDASLLL